MSGPFVFFDLRTDDVQRSQAFYTALAGWHVTTIDAGATTIPLLTDDHGPWGGFTPLPVDDPRARQWVPYIAVEDVDAAAERAVELGATIAKPRTDLPAGSAVVITDPGGAAVCLWQTAQD